MCEVLMVTLPEGSSGPSPIPAELLHEEAIRLYEKGKYEEALGLIEGALKCEERFSIISNGQLLDRRAFETFDLKRRLMQVDISVDAARAETYEMVRRGGDFNRLLRNLQFLDDFRAVEGETFRIVLRFVVSAMNFREIPEFVNLARRFHADSVLFTIIRNWGSFTDCEFERMNVASSTNPLHGEFVEILNSPELLDPIVDMGSIEPYRKKSAQPLEGQLA
jgi:sulfatase maturation enzyme AslB (radical SAM superfamily)